MFFIFAAKLIIALFGSIIFIEIAKIEKEITYHTEISCISYPGNNFTLFCVPEY
jgi:hypothetical protein